MNWILYVLRHSLKDIRQDLIAFRLIKDNLEYCSERRKNLNEKLVVRYTDLGKNTVEKLGCVKQKLTYSDDGLYAFKIEVCKKFDVKNLRNKCDDKNCPYVQTNSDYIEANKKFLEAEEMKRNFWAGRTRRAK